MVQDFVIYEGKLKKKASNARLGMAPIMAQK